MNLAQALRLLPTHSQPPTKLKETSVAFVGAGGKTTALFQLAQQLPTPLVVTTTSHLGVWQIPLGSRHIIAKTISPLESIEHNLHGVILVTGPMDKERVQPVATEVIAWLREFCGYHSMPLLIEADGSRQKPLKAPAEHEPPIPKFTQLVVQVAGISGLGKSLAEEHVHRPEVFARLSGMRLGETITPEALARVSTHPDGGLKNIPANARRVALLNQADTPELQAQASTITKTLLSSYEAVVVASLQAKTIYAVHEPIAGIILAGGASTRFGQPKQLLDWHGQSFVRAVTHTALAAGLSPVVVVTGSHAGQIGAAVQDLPVIIVRNTEWKSGQASSIKKGVSTLASSPSKQAGGVIFLLADQPQVKSNILHALVEQHAITLAPIIAPLVMDRRANPVLFDRDTFPDLMMLEGDVGGRSLFSKHKVTYLPWHSESLLLDVDNPEDYKRLLHDES